jgi:hypothetical protein
MLIVVLPPHPQLPGPHKLLRGAGRPQQQHAAAAAAGGGHYGGVGGSGSSGVSPAGSHHHRKAKGAKQKAILQARAFKVRLYVMFCGFRYLNFCGSRYLNLNQQQGISRRPSCKQGPSRCVYCTVHCTLPKNTTGVAASSMSSSHAV